MTNYNTLISCNLLILSVIGGWVLNKLAMKSARSGLTINKCAVEGFAPNGRTFDASSSFAKALASPVAE